MGLGASRPVRTVLGLGVLFVVAEAPVEGGVALGDFVVADGDVDGATGTDEDDELLGAGDGGVEEVALEHHVVLGGDGDDDAGVFGALAFVDTDGVGVDQFVCFEEVVDDGEAVHVDGDRLLDGVEGGDTADVPIKDPFVIIIDRLHHFVADAEGTAVEPFFRFTAARI